MSYTWRRKLARLWRKAEVMEQEFLAESKKICKNADESQSGLIFGHDWVAGFTKSSQVPDDETCSFVTLRLWLDRTSPSMFY